MSSKLLSLASLASLVYSVHAETFTASGVGTLNVGPFAGEHTFHLTGVPAANNVNWFVNSNLAENDPAGTPARFNRRIPVGTTIIEARNRRPNGTVVGVTMWRVTVPNRPPVAQVPALVSLSPTQAKVRLTASEPDGQSVRLEWFLRSANGALVRSGTVNDAMATLDFTLARGFSGGLFVHAVDALGLRSVEVSLPIIAPNVPPTIELLSSTPLPNGAALRLKVQDADQLPKALGASWRWSTNNGAAFREGGSIGVLANGAHTVNLSGLPGGIPTDLVVVVTDGKDSASVKTRLRPLNAAPAAPVISVDSNQTRSNQLSIAVVPGVDRFDSVSTSVSVRAIPGGTVLERTWAGTNQGSFNVTGLLPNTQYVVTARTTDAAGEVSKLVQTLARTLPLSLPPMDLALKAVSPDRIQVIAKASGTTYTSGLIAYVDGTLPQQEWQLADLSAKAGDTITFDSAPGALKPGSSGWVLLFGHSGKLGTPQRNLSAQAAIRFTTSPLPQGTVTLTEESESRLRFDAAVGEPWGSAPLYCELEGFEPVAAPLDLDKGGLDPGTYVVNALVNDVFGKRWPFASVTFEVTAPNPTPNPEDSDDTSPGTNWPADGGLLPGDEPLSAPMGQADLRVTSLPAGGGWVWVAGLSPINSVGDRYFTPPGALTLYPTPYDGYVVEAVMDGATVLASDEWGGYTLNVTVPGVRNLEVRFAPVAP
jgi:hypothetical protein